MNLKGATTREIKIQGKRKWKVVEMNCSSQFRCMLVSSLHILISDRKCAESESPMEQVEIGESTLRARR